MPMKLAPTLQPLYRHLTWHCADLVVKNWQQTSRLTVYRAAIDKFYIKEKVLKVPVKKPLPNNHKKCIQYIKPRFERTCVVEVIIVQGNVYLKCTCCEYEQCSVGQYIFLSRMLSWTRITTITIDQKRF
jgi:hypothetical protein